VGLKPKIVLTVNAAWNIATFRAGLVKALLRSGYEVVAAAPPDPYVDRVRALGCRFVPVYMETAGTHPLKDLMVLFRYWRLFRRERPDAVLCYTIKPNAYGSLAAAVLRIPYINNVAGLGTTFLSARWLNQTARFLYRVAFWNSSLVFFQNNDDLELFIEQKLVSRSQAVRIPGSGVDTSYFTPRAVPPSPTFRFLLFGRLLGHKGVREYVHAARLLRTEGKKFEAQLMGFLDVENPSAISEKEVKAWVDGGDIVFLGNADDVRPAVANADCVVLPSYREGLPKALLEAASMAKPVIATDVPGCRDVVVDGVTGFLVCARDPRGLADAMSRVLELGPERRAEMGIAARKRVLMHFDEQIVVKAYLDALATIHARMPSTARINAAR
jgi:glycosyltransferase involved in cell wall biosynthesis